MQRLNFIWQLSRLHKRIISVLVDSLLITLSLYMAMWTRLGNTRFLDGMTRDSVLIIGLIIICTILIYTKIGLYRAVLRYLTLHALSAVTLGAILSACVLAIIAYYFRVPVPRTVPIIYCAFLALMCGGARLVVRSLVVTTSKSASKEVLIYGAGSGGRQLAVALRTSGHYRVRAFIDEDVTLTNTVIMGLPVIELTKATELIEKHDITQILLAIPSASRARRKQILSLLAPLLICT